MNRIFLFVAVLLTGACSFAQTASTQTSQPILDMHVHAYPSDWVRNVLGTSATAEESLPDPPNPLTGKRSGAKTDAELLRVMLAAMKQHNIVRVIASGPLDIVYQWKSADPDRII